MILGAATGRFPASDGGWRRLAPWRPDLEAVFAFTGHAVVCVGDDVETPLLEKLGVNGLGGAHAPRVLTTLAGPNGWTSSLDVVLVHRAGSAAHGDGPPPGGAGTAKAAVPALVERPDLVAQPRVAYAARLRSSLVVYGYPSADRVAVAVVGRGLAGLRELSYELEADRRGRGEGAAFVHAALRAAGTGEPLVACAAPGNVASLRILLACGFVPVGSVQLFRRQPGYVPSRSG